MTPIRFTHDIGDPQDPLAKAGESGTIIEVKEWCYVVIADSREYLVFAVDEGDFEVVEEIGWN